MCRAAGFIRLTPNERNPMTEMNRLVAYIAQPGIDDALDARLPVGANFDPGAM